jgi:hypothetical protein
MVGHVGTKARQRYRKFHVYISYTLKIMMNKVILYQNLNAGLKILPQERQAAKFKFTTLRG